uniref:DUF6598 domain-containing protein n=1 Tax=Arundo donax TaxID=35708 RepID=A0A0A9G4A5_ARUDO
MEHDGEVRSSEIAWGNPNAVVVELSDEFFRQLLVMGPRMDPDAKDYAKHVLFWKAILGIHPSRWTLDTRNVAESNRHLAEEAVKNIYKYQKDEIDYFEKIEELNSTLSVTEKKFNHVTIKPRSPYPRCLHLWHQQFRMTNTCPTSVRNMRFSEPGANEYVSSALLQFFSLRFAGDFSPGETMSVYGFVAVRDDVDELRNYIFKRSREHAQEITPDSPDLPLMPPSRGISAPFAVIVEYSLKVKSKGTDGPEDGELIDGCFEFEQSEIGPDVQLRKVRMFGSLGPVDVHFVFLRYAVEATIDVKVKRAAEGYNLNAVAVSTCGYIENIVLYDKSALPVTASKNCGVSSWVAVASAVVAVELGCELKLIFDIATEYESDCGIGSRPIMKDTHELTFTAQKHKSSKGKVVLGKMFKMTANVTWSTMGSPYMKAFHSNRSLLGENPLGPCC